MLSKLDDKILYSIETIVPIMPENFLKEYGAIQDENVLSIQNIFEITKEIIDAYNRKKEALEKQWNQACANAVFRQLIGGNNRRRGHF